MENIEKNFSIFLTWQIFFQKWKSFIIVNSEPYWKNVNPPVIFFLGVSLKPEPSSLEGDKQLNEILRSFLRTLLMFVSYVCKKLKMFGPPRLLVPTFSEYLTTVWIIIAYTPNISAHCIQTIFYKRIMWTQNY